MKGGEMKNTTLNGITKIKYTAEESRIIETLDEQTRRNVRRGLITLQDVIKSTTRRA